MKFPHSFVGAAVAAAALFLLGSCMLGTDDQVSSRFGPKVGIVEINGLIYDSHDTIRQIVDFRDDKNVKAIVVRVDSPGGAVGAVQEIYRELMKLRKTKKIAASLGTTAASGGLYIASAADRIFTSPGTVTGSIGAIAQVAEMDELLSVAKIKVNTIKSGKFKDTGSPTRPMTPEDAALMNGIVMEVRSQFINDIAKGRGCPAPKIEGIADGRVMTGQSAIDLGLADEIGNIQDAIEWAGKAGGIEGKPSTTYGRKRKSAFLRELLDSLAGEFDGMASSNSGFKLFFK